MTAPALLLGLVVFLSLLGYREWRERKADAPRQARLAARAAALVPRPAPSRTVFGLRLGESRLEEARGQLSSLGLDCQESVRGPGSPRLRLVCPAPPARLGRASAADSGQLALTFAGPTSSDPLAEVVHERGHPEPGPALADFRATQAALGTVYGRPAASTGSGEAPTRAAPWQREWRFTDLDVSLSLIRPGRALLVTERLVVAERRPPR